MLSINNQAFFYTCNVKQTTNFYSFYSMYMYITKHTEKKCVFQVSALKKTRYGRSALLFYFNKIFYIDIAFFTTVKPPTPNPALIFQHS